LTFLDKDIILLNALSIKLQYIFRLQESITARSSQAGSLRAFKIHFKPYYYLEIHINASLQHNVQN